MSIASGASRQAWPASPAGAGLKKAFLMFVPLLAYGLVLVTGRGEYAHVHFLRWTLVFGRVDSLSLVFAVIMSGMCCIGTLYDTRQISSEIRVAKMSVCVDEHRT